MTAAVGEKAWMGPKASTAADTSFGRESMSVRSASWVHSPGPSGMLASAPAVAVDDGNPHAGGEGLGGEHPTQAAGAGDEQMATGEPEVSGGHEVGPAASTGAGIDEAGGMPP